MFSYKNSSIKLKLYVVNTYSGLEGYVKKHLLERISKFSLEQYFGDVIVPLEMSAKLNIDKAKFKICFPGYIIVEAHLNQQTWLLIKQTPKVIGFIGNSINPIPLSINETKNIRNLMINPNFSNKNCPYKIGDCIKIKKGPFMNLVGIIEKINLEKQKVKIMVSIFGRLTPVEVDFLYINRIN